jgi:hypothetical protein
MRERRAEYEKRPDDVRLFIKKGTLAAIKKTNEILTDVRAAIGVYNL